jgi:hypothetical protein
VTSKTSIPTIKKRNSIQKKRVDLIDCSSDHNNDMRTACKENFKYKEISKVVDSGDLDDKFFSKLGKDTLSNFNASSNSSDTFKSEFIELSQSNGSLKSNFSISKKILESHLFSLERNSLPTLSSINLKMSQNEYNNKSNNSYFLQNSSPLERNINNVSKNLKITPRQNICLGDFIGTEIRNLKKGNNKKYNSKIASINTEEGNDEKIFVSNSAKQLEHSKRRRKVNPTRLNVNEKGIIIELDLIDCSFKILVINID